MSMLTGMNAYWRSRMAERMSPDDEVTRLVTTLKGFCLDAGPPYDPSAFHAGGRPYGAKNIADSIAFHLGWDRDRVLCTSLMPEWVNREAFELHRRVGEKLKEVGCDHVWLPIHVSENGPARTTTTVERCSKCEIQRTHVASPSSRDPEDPDPWS